MGAWTFIKETIPSLWRGISLEIPLGTGENGSAFVGLNSEGNGELICTWEK